MRFGTELRIRAVGTWLPDTRDTAVQAMQEDRLAEDTAQRIGVRALPVSDVPAPDMAVRAAQQALARAGWQAQDIDLLIHTWLYYQGHELWSPPHYIANQLGAHHCLPLAIHQGCDGGALALYDAALRLRADPDVRRALVTSSDRYVLPGIDRWNSYPSMGLGDAAGAVLLHRPLPQSQTDDAFSLLALNTLPCVETEVFLRGQSPLHSVPLGGGAPVDAVTAARQATADMGKGVFDRIAREHIERVLHTTLYEAGISADDPRLRCLVLPRVGARTLDQQYLPVVQQLPCKLLGFDDDTGHLGCSDWAADLDELHGQRILEPGDVAVLIGAGGGFTWTCAVVQAPTSTGKDR
ncbi:3-oxoacyl-[acyl-carrier-protein] synthase III C-terminal domain-containing protein [Streptomyces huasconensis]|uniref:3-oxoacyl-[acyl-carrier-protein] synthase III C-terminal domain-containing protein n=1 Tax=Streptomyces huasconensis TaxID=1854574 RepID=A0ABV3LN32_9ACTN